MPVIVVGADTEVGGAVSHRLLRDAAEVRAFVTDPDAGAELKAAGAKVAVGDVSDETHVAAAAHRTFCAVLVAEAARDARERSFASDAEGVVDGWARALRSAGTTRAIWVDGGGLDPEPIRRAVTEFTTVDMRRAAISHVVEEVAALEAAASVAPS